MDQAKNRCFIAQLRKDAGLTQAQLGELVGVTNKTVSRWENGNYMPDLDTCLHLSDLFGITVNELLLGQRLNHSRLRQTANQALPKQCAARLFPSGAHCLLEAQMAQGSLAVACFAGRWLAGAADSRLFPAGETVPVETGRRQYPIPAGGCTPTAGRTTG